MSVQLRLRYWATVIRITCSLARVDCFTALDCPTKETARGGPSAPVRLGVTKFDEMVADGRRKIIQLVSQLLGQ
jgi:hypothetical protein